MNIVEPSVEYYEQIDIYNHIARCARVCYNKHEKISSNDANKSLVKRLINSGHVSMLRHGSVYAIIPTCNKYINILNFYANCPYLDYIVTGDYIYLATNANFIYDTVELDINNIIKSNEVNPLEFSLSKGKELMRYTFKIVTQISTSRELNRVSPNNIAEMSTRYVKVGTICRPHWLDKSYTGKEIYSGIINNATYYMNSCDKAFRDYKLLINDGMKPEDARGILPLDTTTIVIYTYSVNEWEHIINLRADVKHAHPNAQIIANMIKKQLNKIHYGRY